MAEQIRWIRSDGAVYPLTDQPDVDCLFNREGFFMPPVSYVEETPVNLETKKCCEVSTQEGKVVRRLNIEPREVRAELNIKGTDPANLRQNIRKYMNAFSPLFGEGELEVTAPGGEIRRLKCRYLDGLNLSETPDQTTRTSQKAKIILIAYDPYWYATASTTLTLVRQENIAAFFPFPPLKLSQFGSFNESDINNDGDITTYSIWTIYGPAESLQIDNLSTGEKITLYDPDSSSTTVNLLAPGQYLTIDCRPGFFKVERSDGANLFEFLSTDSTLFGFPPGETQIRIEAAGATSETRADLTYHKRYLVV